MAAEEKVGPSPEKTSCTDICVESVYPDETGLKIYGHGKPVRLFVAGLHGDEWKDTTEILMGIKPPEKGTLALIPLVKRGKYISTLDPDYYPEWEKAYLKPLNP